MDIVLLLIAFVILGYVIFSHIYRVCEKKHIKKIEEEKAKLQEQEEIRKRVAKDIDRIKKELKKESIKEKKVAKPRIKKQPEQNFEKKKEETEERKNDIDYNYRLTLKIALADITRIPINRLEYMESLIEYAFIVYDKENISKTIKLPYVVVQNKIAEIQRKRGKRYE